MSEQREIFRSDIAGLRAIAVLLVLFSHFGIPGFGFGFIGVDVFFVISGFLITRILYKDYLSTGEGTDKHAALSLKTFYLRRIRRLLPAAITVILIVNVVSYFLYNSASRSDLVQSSKWALLFLANVSFLRSESDYFQQENNPSMLQHYWSLSVEEQFYFIWPILFLIAASFQKFKVRNRYFRFNKRILLLIGLITTCSFIFLQVGFKVAPLEAYFSIFSRAWELGVGSFLGILAFHKPKHVRFSTLERYLPLVVTLSLCSLTISRDNWALLVIAPVLATGFFLYSGQDQVSNLPHNSKIFLFTRSVLLYIGQISYSLYLVHWPLFVIVNHFGLSEKLIWKVLLFPLSILLAHLLYKFIEIPFQNISIPKKSSFEVSAFNFVKIRRMLIGALSFALVGSMYLITYPSATSRLIYSESNLQQLVEDPTLNQYANYQSNLINQINVDSPESVEGIGNVEDSVTVVSLDALLAQNQESLRSGLRQTQISDLGKAKFLRLSSDVSPFESSNCARVDTEKAPDCSRGNFKLSSPSSTTKKVALIGDSKMGQFVQPLMEYFSEKGWQVVPYVMNGCPIFSPQDKTMKNCTKRSEWVKNQISLLSFDLVIATMYPYPDDSHKSASSYISSIDKAAKKTILLTQFPAIGNPKNCVKPDWTYSPSCFEINQAESQTFTSFKSFLSNKTSATISVIDTTAWTCIGLNCPIAVGDTFLTRDGSHLSYSFIKLLTPIMFSTLDSLLRP